ncbi:MAG: nicotinate (nicotinamide) nucleotide adenylyltransferase [Brachymonas sp.]
MRKLLYYGGSFDPPHAAHRAVLQAALRLVQPDAALIVPTGNASSYKTRALSAPEHRLAMCDLAFADFPQVQISSVEAYSDTPSYTIETLENIEQSSAQPIDWHLLLGTDQMAHIQNWQRWQPLLSKVTVILAPRAGLDAASLAQSRHNSALCARLQHVPTLEMDVSSTDLRQRLSHWGASRRADTGIDTDTAALTALLGAPVLRYIAAHSLYF